MPGTISLTFGCLNPTGTAYTAQYSNSTGTICTELSQTVYTSGSWGPGETVYTNSGLSTPLVGYDYISESTSSVIYNLNSSTGVIGSSTGLLC